MDGDWLLMPGKFLYVIYVLTWLLIPHVLFRKRNPASAMAWIWAILLFPILGAVFYLGFGTNRVSRKYLKRKAKARLGSERSEGSANGFGSKQVVSGAIQRQLRMLERMTGRKNTYGNQIELLMDASAFYTSFLQKIKGANSN